MDSVKPKARSIMSDLNCGHEWLKPHRCCQDDVWGASPILSIAWHGFIAAQRKRHCYEMAMANEDPEDPYDFFVVVRPDLAILEPVASLGDLSRRPPRVYIASKEAGEPPGDYLYIVPRTLASDFFGILRDFMTPICHNEHRVHWPPEYALSPALSQIPRQIMAWALVIVRENGQADCQRLENEVFHHSLGYRNGDGVPISLADYCRQLVDADRFSVTHSYNLQ
jgi:hypothetical protein